MKVENKNVPLIPKVIHYCWFGGKPLPELAKKCVLSWKKMCPEYAIVEWNESNYSTDNVYAKEAFEHKKWAFYSDYARLDIIYQYGGIYLDTDVELVKSLDQLLNVGCFLGMETSGYIATGLGFGAVKHDINIKSMLDEYEGKHLVLMDGTLDDLPCPKRNTKPFIKYGFNKSANDIQLLNGAVVYPSEYFCPLDYESNILRLTANTISIHQYNSSWLSEEDIEHHRIEQKIIQKWGIKKGRIIVIITSTPYWLKRKIRERGIKGTIKFIIKEIRKLIVNRKKDV